MHAKNDRPFTVMQLMNLNAIYCSLFAASALIRLQQSFLIIILFWLLTKPRSCRLRMKKMINEKSDRRVKIITDNELATLLLVKLLRSGSQHEKIAFIEVGLSILVSLKK